MVSFNTIGPLTVILLLFADVAVTVTGLDGLLVNLTLRVFVSFSDMSVSLILVKLNPGTLGFVVFTVIDFALRDVYSSEPPATGAIVKVPVNGPSAMKSSIVFKRILLGVVAPAAKCVI